MMTPSIQPQILNLKESATLSINQKALSMRKEGVDICHLGFGESPFPVPEIMVEALKQYSSRKNYLPGMGLPELRDAAASVFHSEYELDSSRENTVVGPGSKELIFHLLMLLEGPFIIPAPSWVSYGPQAHILSKPVHTVSTERKDSYRLQAGELNEVCKNLGTGQKILILNNPCNPTGAVYPPQELEELAQVCRDQNVVVISDEIYALIDFSGRKFVSISKFYPEGTLVTGGLSKAFSAGGWRLGLTFVPKAMSSLIKPWNALISETYSCVSAPIQYGALAAFENFEEIRPRIDQCCTIHSLAGSYLHRRFIKMNLNCPKPEGAFYLFPDFQNHREGLSKRGIFNCGELVEDLLKRSKVAVLPGNDFFMDSENLCVRVASVDYSGPDVLKHFQGLENCSDAWVEKQMPNLKLACDRIQDWIS
jgi:aspartate/methionine/tyrosine aminotransferase|tara:strand:- start:137 stop:1405 length:1269 start_codon:yes stop_codon:yes gene_type:complete